MCPRSTRLGSPAWKLSDDAAVEPLGDLGEDRRAAVRQQVDDLAVLLAHARHDLAGGVELAELAADVALDGVELGELCFGVEGQGAGEVVVAGDRRQFAAALLEEGPLDVVVPLDGVEDADGPLGLDEAVAEAADPGFKVGRQGATLMGAAGRGLPSSRVREVLRSFTRLPGGLRACTFRSGWVAEVQREVRRASGQRRVHPGGSAQRRG